MQIALIGASFIAGLILPTIKSTAFTLAGVAAGDEKRGSLFAHLHGISFLGSYENVFQNSTIGAVYISTLNHQHEHLIRQALLSGKHVLCEKPLVLTAKSARELFALAQEKNLILMEGLMYRFHPQVAELLKVVHSGEYGKPKKIRATFCFDYGDTDRLQRRLASGGGALPDLGCYLIDFVAMVLPGVEIVSVLNIEPVALLCFHTILTFKNGIVADIQSSMDSPSLNVWEVVCEKAALSVSRCLFSQKAESFMSIVDDDSNLRKIPIPESDFEKDQFVLEFQNFYDAILGNTQPFVSPEQSIHNASVIEWIGSS
jgi:predicted dehydrogenase